MVVVMMMVVMMVVVIRVAIRVAIIMMMVMMVMMMVRVTVIPILHPSYIWVLLGPGARGPRRVNLLKQRDCVWDRLEQFRIGAGVYDFADVLCGGCVRRMH